MRVSFLVALMLLVGFSAVPAMADGTNGGDPTFTMSKNNPSGCGTATFSDASNFTFTLAAGAGACENLSYTGPDVTTLEMLIVSPDAIICITDIFQSCTAQPELVNGQLATLLNLFGAGPCLNNGANNPAETCIGDLGPNGVAAFTISSPDGFSSSQAISFGTTPTPAPEPSSAALMLLGVGLAFAMRRRIGQRLPQAS
jgi:MYXO-CTERM domain-containing protein